MIDEDSVPLMKVVEDLQECVNDLTKRVKSLETVIADALPDFSSETIKQYSEKKRLGDFIFFKNELFKEASLTSYVHKDSYSPDRTVNITLNIGGKMLFSSFTFKKPTITITYPS